MKGGPLPGADLVPDWRDEVRRQIGRALDVCGLGAQETPHRIVTEMPGARLRAYHERDNTQGPVLLIIPAPFKRAYIWDLLPAVSVVRHCLNEGLRVYLLEWLLPTRKEDGLGLAEYAERLPKAAINAIKAETGMAAPILAGHSLGGTFAAIFATLHPERVGGLILVDAPLAFGAEGGPLAQAVATIPHARMIRTMAGSPVPGSVINMLSVVAAPDAFQGQRIADFAASLFDPRALAIHLRVERWTYDEFPLPGWLFEETLEQLYREDRFLQSTLQIGQRQTGLARLRSPVMAIINPVGRIVPPRSLLKGLEAAPNLPFHILEYDGDRGPMLQHVGPLIALAAHERLWPEIIRWAHQVGRD
jgi:polyhydroxyalkanoate synthase subunit PhaC